MTRMKTLPRTALAALVLAALMITSGGGSPASATFPGANGKIAFTVDRADRLRVWIMNSGGASKTEVAATPRDNFSPHWKANGMQFVFIATTPSGVDQIYSISRTGNLRTQITTGGKSFLNPAINAGETKIVASGRIPGGNYNLFLMNADGTGLMRFTQLRGALDLDPEFSPDGTQIVFERVKANGDSYIMRKNVDGTGLVQLTGGNGRQFDPGWHPSGTMITYAHATGEGVNQTARVFRMNADGTGRTRISANGRGTMFVDPCYSPDGAKIAYIRLPDGRSNVPDVYTMTSAGTMHERLTDHNFRVLDLDWGVA